MTTTEIGRRAEQAAADYLQAQGYTILEQNYRTRWCEIDIVAIRDSTVYFVEVKYRRSSRQGSGLEYITGKKLKQMAFAAEFWASVRHFTGPYQLSALEVSGPNFTVDHFIENVL